MSKSGKGFQIEYPSITLHAVSKGDTSPSIYCQLDESSAKTMKMLFQLQHLALWQTNLVVVLAALVLPLGLSYVYKGNGLSTYAYVCLFVCVSCLCL